MKYIICDMDGTLLNSEKKLPKKLNALLTILKEKNICFGVASGRQYFNLYKQFGDYAKDMLFIAENGGIMYEGQSPIYANEMKQQDIVQIVQHMRKKADAFPIVCGVKSAYLEVSNAQFLENAHMYYERLEIVSDVLEAAKNDKIAKIAIYDSINTDQNSYPYVQQLVEQLGLHAVVSGIDWMDIANRNVNKGKAIQIIKAKEHITADEFVAFGDYMNDYEMMKECTYSYAMANAYEKLKEVCAYETCSNDEDGVIKGICSLLAIDYQSL